MYDLTLLLASSGFFPLFLVYLPARPPFRKTYGMASIISHELEESATDPDLNAWYDRRGYENADKCAWTFGAPSVPFKNGTYWKIQGNWSNAAANTNSGYANGGCIQTK